MLCRSLNSCNKLNLVFFFFSFSLVSLTLKGRRQWHPTPVLLPGKSHGRRTLVGYRILEWVSLSLLQWIFPTQGLNPGLLYCRQILYQLSHQGSPRILEWVAYPFSRGSSWPRNRTGVSCIAGRFFTSWAMREVNNYTTDVLPQKWKLWTWHEVPQIRVMGGGAPRGTSPFHHEGCINLLDTLIH